MEKSYLDDILGNSTGIESIQVVRNPPSVRINDRPVKQIFYEPLPSGDLVILVSITDCLNNSDGRILELASSYIFEMEDGAIYKLRRKEEEVLKREGNSLAELKGDLLDYYREKIIALERNPIAGREVA